MSTRGRLIRSKRCGKRSCDKFVILLSKHAALPPAIRSKLQSHAAERGLLQTQPRRC